MSKKNARKKYEKKANNVGQLRVVPDTRDMIREGLLQTVISLGLEEIAGIVEEERTRICGPRYAHDPARGATRMGSTPSELVLGGRRVSVRRPRARTTDGHEVELQTWQQFADEDPLEKRAMEQMLVGVSTRKYKRSLEPTGKAVKDRGTSRSAVSRRFVVGTEKRLQDLQSRDLSNLQLAVLMIDGVHFSDDHVVLAALGFDEGGGKHVLGIQEGATENTSACAELLANLVERGMHTDRSLLVVIDGSKALRKAVKNLFGKRAVIQRCQEHKIRNVTDHLPEDMRVSVRKTMQDAYKARDIQHAKKMLLNLHRTLQSHHPGAAGSLTEGLDETLTLIRFALAHSLERSFATTNPIENLIGRIRDTGRRVKRWKTGTMVLRWAAAGVLEAEKKFRRIRGYKSMPRLVAELRDRDRRIEEGLELDREVA